MTKQEQERILARKAEFLKEMGKKHELAEEYIVRLLKAWGVRYNEHKEGEIDMKLKAFIDKEIESKREALRTKILATPRELVEPCWLHAVEGINCEGTIHRNGGLPECSVGGVVHYFASRRNNPVAFLGKVEAISNERNRVREEELKAWKAGMARPFDPDEYQIQMEVLQDELIQVG